MEYFIYMDAANEMIVTVEVHIIDEMGLRFILGSSKHGFIISYCIDHTVGIDVLSIGLNLHGSFKISAQEFLNLFGGLLFRLVEIYCLYIANRSLVSLFFTEIILDLESSLQFLIQNRFSDCGQMISGRISDS